MKGYLLFITLGLALSSVLVMSWFLNVPGASIPAARAASYTVCLTGPPTCDYGAIQAAVDATGNSDVIKVATDTYTNTDNRGDLDLAQIVYTSNPVTIHGDYTVDNWTVPDFEADPTTLDTGEQGRVLYITRDISPHIESLHITGSYVEEQALYQPPDPGGGIYVVKAAAITSNNQIFNNPADVSGGISLLGSNAILNGNVFSDNHADIGGAATDVGVSTGADHDIDGEPSPMSWGYGIGADESSYSGPNICLQNPAKCPLDEDVWPGESDAWQRTGRKWSRHSGTADGMQIVWEWSAPYAGSKPDYADYRENYYEDYSKTPDAYPVVTGTAPAPFAWALWEPMESDYILHQYGGPTAEEANAVGKTDCSSGLYYPIVSQNLGYVYTPMSVMREGQCVEGGYISAYRADLWGPPLSLERVEMCDQSVMGIPANQSPKGNTICKISPYVGVVYQRYVFGAGPTSKPSVGCEAVVYAWGWPTPQQPTSGQDYQNWFRNGELRFSRWLNLSAQVSDDVPDHSDHTWWNDQCERAWTDMPNWLYTGNYKIGFTVYTDTIAMPLTTVATIPTSGGSLTSNLDNVSHTFGHNTFTDTVIVTHTTRFQSEFTSTNNLVGINRFYELNAVYSETGESANPKQPYTVTIRYTDANRGPAIEDSLALHSKSGDHWIKDPSSVVVTGTAIISGTNVVYTDRHMILANPNHFSLWAVLGKTQRVFLPLVTRILSSSR